VRSDTVPWRTSFLLASVVIAAAVAAGCASRFKEPEPEAPHAVVVFPSQAAQSAAFLFLEPLEFNDVPRPRNWKAEHFRVPPGELRLRVRVAQENRQGTCELRLTTAAGMLYAVAGSSTGDAFSLTASREGEAVAGCEAPKTLLPTPPGMPPGVPPR
jgi:hypothetical protein